MKSGFYSFAGMKRLTDFCCHIVATEFLKAGKIKKFISLPVIFFKDLSEDEFEQLKVVAERYQGVYEPLIIHTISGTSGVEDVEDGTGTESLIIGDIYLQKPLPPPDFMDKRFHSEGDRYNEDEYYHYNSSDPEIRKVVWFILGLVAAIALFVYVYTR